MFIQLAGSRRSWQKPGGAIISLVMILSMLILSFILYFKFRISGRYLLSEESGYLLFIFGKEDFNEADKKVAAICAAPGVFGANGILKGRKATCYPGCEEKLKGAVLSEEAVVRDKNVTTSRGVGTAIAFALELISQLEGEVKAHQIKKSIVY